MGAAREGAPPPFCTHDHHRRGNDPAPRAPRDLEELRLGPGAQRGGVRGPPGRGDGPRRGQRRRQVDPDQVRRRDAHAGQWRHRLRRRDGPHPRAEGRRQARNRGRLSGSSALRQPRRRPEHVPRPRGTRLAPAAQGARDGGQDGGDDEEPRGDDDPLDPAAGRDPLRRPASVGRRRAGSDVELAARDPRRADCGARRGPDGAGARACRPAGPPGTRRRADLAQPARHLRGRGPDHGPAARPQHRRLRAREDDAAGGRAGDHRRHPDQGVRDRVDRSGGAV